MVLKAVSGRGQFEDKEILESSQSVGNEARGVGEGNSGLTKC